MRILCICVLTVTFFPINTSLAQFAYDRIENETDFGYKPWQFYWTPRYNRVEGVFLNAGARFRPEKFERVRLYADGGWGFWNEGGKQFRFNAGIRRDFLEFRRVSLGVDVFRKLGSADNWLVNDVENSLSAILFRDDFRDYYGVHGFRLYADHYFLEQHTLRFEVVRQTYDQLKRNIDWSVFDGSFDENPVITPPGIVGGNELAFRLIGAFDWRDNPIFPLNGWFLEFIYEHTEEDFKTDGLFLSAHRFLQTVGNQRLILRGLLGSRHGSTAEQYLIDFGGVGTLRGFDDREFSGNRVFMLSANYMFGGDIMQKVPVQRVPVIGSFWTMLSLGVFVDTGWSTLTDISDGIFEGFGDFSPDNFKTDIGLSLYVLEGVFRMDLAKRTDRSNDDWRLTFRLLQTF
jgi:outer membrane protein assembly factor BamA